MCVLSSARCLGPCKCLRACVRACVCVCACVRVCVWEEGGGLSNQRLLPDDSLSYIKVINLSSKVVCNKIHGRTQHRILAFLMSLHVIERPVWLVRPGPVDVDPSVYMGSCHPGVYVCVLACLRSLVRWCVGACVRACVRA